MAQDDGNNKIEKWKRFVAVFLPIVVLTGFTILFSGASSSSDCGDDSDCSSSSAELANACGAPLNADKSGTVKFMTSVTAKSAQTDLRCGYGVSWKYNWTKEKKPPKTPPVSINVKTSKSSPGKVNRADTGGSDGWAGTYTVARGSISGTAPVLGTIEVSASWTDYLNFGDSASVSLHIVYSSIKK